MVLKVSKEEIEECRIFAQKCAQNQQEIEFGQEDTKPRGKHEIARDNLIGKLAEVAFAKMMEEIYHLHIELDFKYYPRGKWDKQDAVVNGWRIDVKGTRKGGKWMLIEWSKLNFRKKQNLLAHFYVMSVVGWDRKKDEPTGEVELSGYAALGELKNGYDKTMVIRKGETIPGTNTKLQADNYARKIEDLHQDWDGMLQYLQKKDAADTSGYDGI